MTHQQFADAVGVSRGSVQQWESGATAPKRPNQPAVARFMGITVSELMNDEISPTLAAQLPPPADNPPISGQKQPLAGESISSGAIDINEKRRGPLQALDVLTDLSALLTGVDPGRMVSVAAMLGELTRNPGDAALRDALAMLMAPAAFTQPNQNTG